MGKRADIDALDQAYAFAQTATEQAERLHNAVQAHYRAASNSLRIAKIREKAARDALVAAREEHIRAGTK